MKDPITRPIHIGSSVVIGESEGLVQSFEPGNIDFSVTNERQFVNPTYGHNEVSDAIVNSCSECCMEQINGKPNLLGRMHRKMVGSCSRCPVSSADDHIQARDGKGNLLWRRLPDGSHRPVTKSEAVILEIDGTE